MNLLENPPQAAYNLRASVPRLALALIAAAAIALGGLEVARAQIAPIPIPPPQPGRGAFAGVPPQSAGITLLATTEATSPASLTTTLADAGCAVETIAVLRTRPPEPVPLGPPAAGGDWTLFIAGAPAAANEGFVRAFPTIPANTPFFLRCRSGLTPAVDPANARYRIGSAIYTLLNGRSDVEAAPGSASRVVTTLAEPQSYGDLDGGTSDAAVVLSHSTGGSGTFMYLAVQPGGTSGSGIGATALLGDRVTVTGVSVAQGRVLVTYLTRRPTDAFTTAPTLPVTKLYSYAAGELVEVGSIIG